MRFRDVPKYTQWGNYAVDFAWAHLPRVIAEWQKDFNLDMDPDFQRGYVWTKEQKARFVEYGIRGGRYGMDILFNCPGFHVGELGTMELVDGKQRISAVLGFLANEFPILGEHFSSDFTDEMDIIRQRFRFHVNDLTSRRDVLQWYLDLNSGGTVHTETDLEKVRRLIEKEGKR